MNAILIDGEGTVTKECAIGDLNVNSYKKSQAIVKLKSDIAKSAEKDCIMEFINESAVERCSFEFEDTFEASHSYIMKVKNGSMEIQKCEFYSSATTVDMKLNSSVVGVESGELRISETAFSDLHSTTALLSFNEKSNVTLLETSILNIKCEGDVVSVGGKAKVVMKVMVIENVTVASKSCVVAVEDAEQEASALNCSFGKCANSVEKGSMMQIRRSKEVKVEACAFDGEKEEKEAETVNEGNKGKDELCKWNGSLVDIENSNVVMRETTIRASKAGGLWVSGGNVNIEKGEFLNNNPSIEGYPLLRRNIICSDSGTLNVMSLKGGDGVLPNSSLWMLNEGCKFEGIASERDSSFFIPVLESVEAKEEANRMKLTFKGMLLVPCNLSFSVVKSKGEEKKIEQHDFVSNGFLSERKVEGSIAKDLISSCGNDVEVSVFILFGNAESPSSTQPFILKNKSETEPKGDEIISKGEEKMEWSLFAFIGCIVIVAILLFVIVVVVVQQRKKRNRDGWRVEDGDIEESKNIGRGEWRKEDVAERVEEEEEEEEMRTLLTGETGNVMGVQSEKGEELEVCENKEMVENSFDCEGVIEVVPVNYVEIQTVASLLGGGEEEGTETGARRKEDENVRKRDGKMKKGKRRKGKKRRQEEETDEFGDEREGCEIGLEELGGVAAADDGRTGKPTEYYIGICSAPHSHFSMIGEDSEEQGMKRMMEEEREEEESVMKEIGGAPEKRRRVSKEAEGEEMMKECEGFEEEGKLTDVDGCLNGEESSKGEEKQKRRKKKKKRNQKRKDKSEIVWDIVEMGLLDAG
ncbi:uncharacterized protein MONOS_16435 [Monocercomonoides exilis]|uniref:uncharacterized protein n=1 Tax=Monocercomonoides exilis TaxID=2049356 RepID=UPI0035597D04|nr:hypothetical protein MONOS_16435 [Monocercomonoides exilis]|eukprot:MONOS_16435.1-p1 / transcript=MONOS_16435.1 / gene=MONOS_16435 / organism=Monocercomonoides_exilis_PA203 / gene_product=unspecified product / transcript_product=unspecified product / location=Mono_scaffold01733:2240-4666(-) / protein_length=809 / sequence_SO=supercontig / SO=protein_coding / is_pseudo=false